MTEPKRCRNARRISAAALAWNFPAGSFVLEPEVWPRFMDWYRTKDAQDISGESLRQCLDAGQHTLRDLLFDGGTKIGQFVNVWPTNLGDPVRDVVTQSGDRPCAVSVSILGDASMSASMWMIDRADADALIAVLRERLGEPETEMVTDGDGAEHMQEAFEEHAVHTHPGDQ